MKSTVERFSDRVENYVRYRPGYPPQVLELFSTKMGMTASSVVADIGSGTGISSRLFLENGNTVFGVEPNDKMRQAAEEYLRNFPRFQSVAGTAENTSLEDDSVDFVIAAQAFHWFGGGAKSEFERILRQPGRIVIIWNERQLDTTPFLRDYERLLLTFGTDYEKVRHEKVTRKTLTEFFKKTFFLATFENSQVLDFDGIRGRMFSSSYMPAEDDPAAAAIEKELKAIFDRYASNDKIAVLYDTKVFYSEAV